VLKQATLCMVMVAVCLTIASAQSNQSSDDYHKNEFFVGYSNNQIDEGNRSGLHGFEFSYTRNISRYVGIRADVSHSLRNREVTGEVPDPIVGTFTFRQDTRRSVTNVLGGVQFKDNSSEARFKPFGYALAGIAHNRASFKNFACSSGNCPTNLPNGFNFSFNDTGFAAALGGGLDIKLSRRFDLRAIQVDYNPIYSDSRVDNNFRIGVGIVIH
jgi:hypothetical protein